MRNRSLWLALVLLALLPVTAYSQARTADSLADSPFSSLNTGNPRNGSVRHCTNCKRQNGPCSLAGVGETAGADAIKLGGAWYCDSHSSGTGTGDVAGASASADSELPLFSGTTGKALKRSNLLSGVVRVDSGVVSALATTGSGSVVLNTNPSITGLNASTVFSSGTIPPARIVSNALTANKCLRLSSGGAIETAAEDCGSGGGGTPGGVSGNLAYNEAGTFGGVTNSFYNSTLGRLTLTQKANSNDTLNLQRFTDTSPTGTLLRARNAADNADLFSLSATGALNVSSTITYALTAAPSTPASGFTVVWADSTAKNLRAQDDAGNVSGTVRPITCSGTDKISSITSAGVPVCTADQGGTGTGVITLNGLNTSDQTFVDVDDTNVTLAINSATSTHTFTLGWTGTLAKARQHANTVYIDQDNIYASGAQDFTDAASLTLPTTAGAAPSITARLAYDSTSNTLEYGENGTNRTVVNTAGAQTLSNKTLDNSTTANLRDTLLTLQDNADPTKTVNFEVSAVASGANRVVSIPNANTTTVQPTTQTTNQFVTHIDSSGVVQKAQPSFSNLSGSMGPTQGGTGLTTVAQGDLLYGDATNSWARLGKSTTATRYLANTGASNNPQWDQVNLANGVTGTLNDANLSANVSLLGSSIDLSGAEASGILAAARFPALTGDVTTTSGSVATTISADAVTNAKLANMATATFKGRTTGGTGDPEDLTATQATALLNNATTSLKGLVPAPVTATGKFLRDDLTWVIPAGAGDMVLASTQTNTGAKTFNDGTLLLNGGDYGASDESMPGSPVEKSFYLNTNASSRRLFIYNNSAYRALFQAGIDAVNLASANVTGTLPVANGGTGITSGTSGGIPYFSGSTTIASSAALTANLPVIGGGAGAAPTVGTRSGNTTAFVTTTGTQTSGRCVEIDANGNHIAAAAACGSGGGSGTINSGATNTIPKYTASTTIDDSLLSDDGTTLTYTGSGGFSLTGSGAGYFDLAEGTAPTVVGNHLIFAAPADAPTGGLLYILPSDTPSNGEQLTANISGTTVTLSWDAAGSGGSGDAVSVNGSAATDANFVATTASGTVPSITWSLNTATTPDEISIATVGAASATEAGVVTTGTQTFAGTKTLAAPVITGSISFPDNTRQTFNPGANAAGINVGSQAGDPDTPTNGDLWYDSTANELTARINGANVALGSGGGGGANTALSNLASVAINVSLNSDTDLTDDLGSTSIRWRDLWAGGVIIGGKTLTTEADQSVGSISASVTLAKNDTNTRTFYGNLVKPIFNTGGSNTNTTFNVLAVDTTNTATTGLTTNLLNLAYGGSTKLTVASDGSLSLAGSGGGYIQLTEGSAPSLVANTVQHVAAADAPAGGSAYIWGAAAASGILRVANSSGTMTVTQDAGISHLASSTSADLRSTLSDESGTGAAIFAGGNIAAGTATTASANDSSTLIATTAYVQTELTAYASDTVTFTNKTYDTAGTGNTFTSTHKIWLPAAGCNNTTATSFWDQFTSTPSVPACVTGTNTQKAYLDFADTSGGFTAQTTIQLPDDFTGAIDADIQWLTTATSGNVKWSLSVSCTNTDGTQTDDQAFETASTVTTAAAGVASRVTTSSITSQTITNCGANDIMHIKLFRDGNDAADTISATARFYGLRLTLRRAQ